jgi:hypothetical protein
MLGHALSLLTLPTPGIQCVVLPCRLLDSLSFWAYARLPMASSNALLSCELLLLV